jgi:hypothetical protein
MPDAKAVLAALKDFAQSVTSKMSQLVSGEPEDQLRGPFENFMRDVGKCLGRPVVCTGETALPDRLGRPDFAVNVRKLLAGHVELKAPGKGANPNKFKSKDHDGRQWKRFQALPNLLYTDGNEWGLFRNGKRVRPVARLSGDVTTDGKKAVDPNDASKVAEILTDFLSWQPSIPKDRKGRINLREFAKLLAPLCGMLRDDVTEALKDRNSPLVHLAQDWRQLLFPDADDRRFADAYAQTVTFALLLGRSEGADPLSLASAETALAAQHSLLSRALQVLTDENARSEMFASLDLLLRVIAIVPAAVLAGPEDPSLYFYEDFLAVYDPELRKNVGAYYTPVEVVRAQVRLIDSLLVNRLGKPLGFADPGVVTLDPAAGTGTYLLGVIEHALERVKEEQGTGAVEGQATALGESVHGFELMVGPYAVAELRVSQALRDHRARLPKDGTHVYLTDTLESPHTTPLDLPLYLKPIAEQHRRALQVKGEVPVIACLGNPPYDVHEAAGKNNKARTGGWVRWGESEKGTDAIFRDFLDPAIAAGHGVRVHNLYNLYVYFWRWALWKVFEHETAQGPGVVSFISASSYLDGDAFCGMREHMRRLCDDIWILDLGGEGRGTRKSDNVFAIQTPVAIAVAVRTKKGNANKPAGVRYAQIEGTREEKLAALDAINDFSRVRWQECPDDWQAPFRPAGKGRYFHWPLLKSLMPWQQAGVKAGRTWVIAPEENVLSRRWRALLRGEGQERQALFKDSPTGRKVHEGATQLPPSGAKLRAISDLPKGSQMASIVRLAYRSFDRQFIFADARLLDRPGPALWHAHGDRQVYLTSLFSQALATGPAVTCSASIPDLDHFRGSYGAKAAMPLHRAADGSQSNILPGLLELVGKAHKRKATPEDFVAYVYGVLAQPAFTARYARELETRELRVPITKDAKLFEKVREIGARLLWLHTYGERFVPKGGRRGHVPRGDAKCTKAVPGDPEGYPDSFEYNEAARTLHVGDGHFAPVTPDVFEFEVSGLKVVQSWLKYRMKKGAGKKSSPLDDIRPERWTSQFTTELLELVWVLEATVAGYPEQAKLLDTVVSGPCFTASEVPEVPHSMRKPPARRKPGDDLFEDADG